MTREQLVTRILEGGLVAIVRAPDPGQLVDAVAALADGGLAAAEITFTVPNAPEVIRKVRAALGTRIILGAGTVLNADHATLAIDAGAQFLVSPHLNLDMITIAHNHNIPAMPGAFTPTEIVTAWNAGADVVKLFPGELAGAAYLKAVRAPLPHIRIMPTGGVTLETAASFLQAGACCLGAGSALVQPKLIAARDFDHLRTLANQWVQLIQHTRANSHP